MNLPCDDVTLQLFKDDSRVQWAEEHDWESYWFGELFWINEDGGS